MEVTLLEATEDPEDLVCKAARNDYSAAFVGEQSFEVAGFTVEGHETRHSMDGLAYRVAESTDERPLFAFSGDTEAFAGLGRFANDCRVLAHDCSFPDDVDVSGHPTPTQLGTALTNCAVDRLYLTHLYPHTDGNHEEMRRAVAEGGFEGEIRFARDGLRVGL